MQKRIQKIKRFFKLSIIVLIALLFVFLIVFLKPLSSYENKRMSKWLQISETQKIETLQKIIPEIQAQDLLVACMNKIAELPDSDEMVIRNAAVLCYNGIKLNTKSEDK